MSLSENRAVSTMADAVRRLARAAAAPAALAAAALALSLALPGAADAAIVILMNDEEIEGEIIDVTVEYVSLRVAGGVQRIPLREVRDIEFRSGESVYEEKLRNARKRQEEAREAEFRAKHGVAAVPAPKPGPVDQAAPVPAAPDAPAPDVEPLPPIAPEPAAPAVDMSRLGNVFESERYHFVLRYPSSFKQAEPDLTFLTFRDELGAVPWSFNITYFEEDEAGLDDVRAHSKGELKLLEPHYRAHAKRPFRIDRYTGERTIALYERAGRAIRHDQVILESRRGVLVFNFFSPGATLEDRAVPDVEAVLASLKLK